MAKVLTNNDVGHLVKEALRYPKKLPKEEFAAFMTDIVGVVCRYFGGRVSTPADNDFMEWMVCVSADPNNPKPPALVWGLYDTEGDL